MIQNKQKLLKKIARKYSLNFLVLFGSQVIGRVHKRSDIDIAYSAKKPLNYKKEYELVRDMRQIFNSKAKIDMVNLENISPLLAKEIAFKGNLLVEATPHSFANFQMYAFKLFVEAKPLLVLRDKFIAQNLKL